VTSFKHLINKREIANKGTSIYLPHKTFHMMPPELIDLLALRANKRRLAFSAFFTIDIKGNVTATRFEKTVVRSRAQLTYE
jgi:exoribonuclease R